MFEVLDAPLSLGIVSAAKRSHVVIAQVAQIQERVDVPRSIYQACRLPDLAGDVRTTHVVVDWPVQVQALFAAILGVC